MPVWAETIPADEAHASADFALEYVDGRRAEELRHDKIGRIIVDVLRLADLLHDAELHDDDHIGDAHGFLLVVRHEDGRDAGLLLDAADLLTCLKTEARVQVGQRFIEEQDSGHLRQGPRDRDALLLAATQNNQLIHDLLAQSAVADYQSQPIYATLDELNQAKARKAAERARLTPYD